MFAYSLLNLARAAWPLRPCQPFVKGGFLVLVGAAPAGMTWFRAERGWHRVCLASESCRGSQNSLFLATLHKAYPLSDSPSFSERT